MDPLSVTASIVGLLAAGAKIIKFLEGLDDAEELTRTIANEVDLFRMIMLRLQNFILHSSTRDLPHASMIDLDQVITILISSVMTFSELERELDRFASSPKYTTLRWVMSRSTKSNLRALLKQLKSQKSCLSMMLVMFTCDLHSQAVENMKKLQRTTEELYTTNTKMLQRLQKVASSSDQLSFSDTASVTGSVRSVMSIVSLASFEHTLSRSRLYHRLHRNNQKASSFGQAMPRGCSVLSGISLSEVSNIAVYRLDISLKYVYNSQRYTTLTPPSPLQRLSAYRNRDRQNERHQFLKETILEAVINGPFDADKTLDGQVDMKTLDAVLTKFHDSRSKEHVVESLFDKNADGEVSDTFSKFSLYIACIEGWNDIVKLLLDNGANIESKDLHGWTPLMHTTVAGRTRTLRLLLDRGANIKSLDKSGRSALLLAAETHHSDIVKVLLERGASVDEKDLSGRTALLRAAECGSSHVVKLLLDRGASVEEKDLAGRSALHICAIARVVSTDVVRLLMDYGAIIDSRDSEGRTPLMLAIQSNVLWMYEKLTFIDGADVNATDDQGNTALHLLLSSGVERECKELIDALISLGAETTWENGEGKTATQLAAERGYTLDSNKLRHRISRIQESINEL